MMRRVCLAADHAPTLAWPEGDFYRPGFSSDGRTAFNPGAADTHRRLFLIRAALLEPALLESLRMVQPGDANALSAWAERWHLSDRWCLLLARDAVVWWAADPSRRGWNFEDTGIAVGHFPFAIEPLRLGPFYYDPTWRKRETVKKYVIEQVRRALEDYCHRIEAAGLAAGLKRTPHKREVQHFDWLVRYQVKGESFAAIAQASSYKFKGGRQTVRKAIVELAAYLELTRRPST